MRVANRLFHSLAFGIALLVSNATTGYGTTS